MFLNECSHQFSLEITLIGFHHTDFLLLTPYFLQYMSQGCQLILAILSILYFMVLI